VQTYGIGKKHKSRSLDTQLLHGRDLSYHGLGFDIKLFVAIKRILIGILISNYLQQKE
jgi:hypothetical protein